MSINDSSVTPANNNSADWLILKMISPVQDVCSTLLKNSDRTTNLTISENSMEKDLLHLVKSIVPESMLKLSNNQVKAMSPDLFLGTSLMLRDPNNNNKQTHQPTEFNKGWLSVQLHSMKMETWSQSNKSLGLKELNLHKILNNSNHNQIYLEDLAFLV